MRAQVDRVFDYGRPIDGLEIEGEAGPRPRAERAFASAASSIQARSSIANDHPVNHKHDNRSDYGYDKTPYVETSDPLCAE